MIIGTDAIVQNQLLNLKGKGEVMFRFTRRGKSVDAQRTISELKTLLHYLYIEKEYGECVDILK